MRIGIGAIAAFLMSESTAVKNSIQSRTRR